MKLFLFLVFFMSSLGAEIIYKTVDENGNVVFTDQPSKNAEKIQIKDVQTIDNPNAGATLPEFKMPVKGGQVYKSFIVTEPEEGAGIRSNDGNVSISLSLEPSLQGGDKIIISMDGKEVGSGSGVSLQDIDRGAHSVSARVVDRNGNTLISTSSSFSILRAQKPKAKPKAKPKPKAKAKPKAAPPKKNI